MEVIHYPETFRWPWGRKQSTKAGKLNPGTSDKREREETQLEPRATLKWYFQSCKRLR